MLDSREWMSLLFAEGTPEGCRRMTLLAGYFDDSGTDLDSPAAVIAGFIARPSAWLGFGHLWSQVLTKYGIDVHHQNKWSNRAPPFNDPNEWPTDRLQDYLNELLAVITAHDVVSVGAGIPVQRFKDCLSPKAQSTTTPIGFAAQCLFGEAIEVVRKGGVSDARIAYIFASGTPGYSEIQQGFDAGVAVRQTKEEFGLVSLTTADIRDVMPLQAADLVAYEVFKFIRFGDDDLNMARARYPLRQIADRLQCSWMTPSEESVRDSSRAFEYSAQEVTKEIRRRYGRTKSDGA